MMWNRIEIFENTSFFLANLVAKQADSCIYINIYRERGDRNEIYFEIFCTIYNRRDFI